MAVVELPVGIGPTAGDVRRKVAWLAGQVGFSSQEIAELEIVGTELAANLAQHRTLNGVVRVSVLGQDEGLEIVSLDRGPGIDDVEAVLEDHHSTTGTLGCGLGAVRRLMDEFDIYSEQTCPDGARSGNVASGGTVVLARKWVGGTTPARRFHWGAVTTPFHGETANGDAVYVCEDDPGLLVAVADGLGHGPNAEKASQACIGYIKEHRRKDFHALLTELHEVLRGTNGVALTLVQISPDRGRLVHCGVGNVNSRGWPRSELSLVPRPGILGSGRAPEPRVQEMPWPRNATLLIYTDGISERWSLDDTPDLRWRHVGTISHYLAQRFSKPTDDATIVTIREASR